MLFSEVMILERQTVSWAQICRKFLFQEFNLNLNFEFDSGFRAESEYLGGIFTVAGILLSSLFSVLEISFPCILSSSQFSGQVLI